MKSTIKNFCVVILTAAICCALVSDGWAQSATKPDSFGSASIRNLRSGNSASRYSVSNIQTSLRARSAAVVGTVGVNQRNFLGSGSTALSQRSKPFSSITRGPTVSPYLSLSSRGASASSYQSIIRPQQQRQRENRRQQVYAIQQQRRLNQLAARAPYSKTGDANSAPTGHVAVFQSLGSYQNTGNYFPPPSRPKRR